MLYDDYGRFLVCAIFWELSNPERRQKLPPLYTLKPYADHDLPSAYLIYMNSVDEYDAAMKICKSMSQWRKLISTSWFMNGMKDHGHEGLIQWRKDMEARDKSLAKSQLIVKAEEGNVAAMTKLYNMSPKKIDGRVKTQLKVDNTSKIVDIQERMKGK